MSSVKHFINRNKDKLTNYRIVYKQDNLTGKFQPVLGVCACNMYQTVFMYDLWVCRLGRRLSRKTTRAVNYRHTQWV